MNYLKIILSTIIGICCFTFLSANQSNSQEMLDSQFQSCRQLVQELAHDNTNVLNQFDQFVATIKKSYLKGKGFIHSDILLIIDAIKFSAEKHRFQVRKDPNQTPYIIHPMGVANNLMVIGKVRDTDIIIAALLHDTVEDTDTTFEEVEQRFGIRVADFVREVTDDKSLEKHVRKQLQIDHAHHKSAGAAQIKLSDKLYNLKDLAKAPPTNWERERIDAYFKWAKSVVDELPWVNARLKQEIDGVIEAYWSSQSTQ